MYTTVLVGVDGSDADRDAVAVARHLVRNYDRMFLVNVRPATRVVIPGYVGNFEAEDHKLALRDAVALGAPHGARVTATDVVQLPLYAEACAWSLINSTESQLAAVRAGLGDVGDVEVSVALGPTRDALQAFSETVDALFC